VCLEVIEWKTSSANGEEDFSKPVESCPSFSTPVHGRERISKLGTHDVVKKRSVVQRVSERCLLVLPWGEARCLYREAETVTSSMYRCDRALMGRAT